LTAVSGTSTYESDGPEAGALKGVLPFAVRADATKSSGSSGIPIIGYVFDFGDGTMVQSPKSVATHTYKKSGVYDVKVEVTDANGMTGDHIGKVIANKPVE
jgi:PKD repeat protein